MRRTRLTGGLAMLLTLLGLTLAVPALATPNSMIVKSVRNATTNPAGAFTSTTTAKPGDTIEYQIFYKNAGAGLASDVKVSDTLAPRQTYVSCTGGCTTVGSPVNTVKWTFGNVGPGGTKTVTFKVKLDSTFPPGQTLVKNSAVVSTDEECPKRSNETTVIVGVPVAAPRLTLVKAADKTTVVAGNTIKYTLTYGNTGTAPATSTTISETIPAGTSFVSCTGTCSNSAGTVTYQLGTVNPGATGSVTLTVKVNAVVDTCAICNVATIKSPSQSSGAPISSNRVCITASPTSDPSTATARGSTVGLKAYVPVLGLPLLNVDISHATSSKTGPGQAADDDQFGTLDIIGPLKIAKATLLRTTSSSQVTQATGARQTSTSEVLDLNLLNGVVTADVLRSVASTTATGSASSFSAAGTTAVNLKVNGLSVANLAPGTRINLNAGLFGAGAYVAVNEQTGSTGGPASGQLSGGTYRADLTVTGVRVYITGGAIGTLLTGVGGKPVDITVAKATAHSDHKQTRLCTTGGRTQAVSGHAYIAALQINPLLPPSTVGFVDIPASGGSAHMSVTGVVLPNDGSIVTTSDAASDTTGTNGPTSSTASSYAQTAGACVLRTAASNCLIRATLLRSQANSGATSSSRSSNATGSQFVNLLVAGIPIVANPAPNTTISLGGLGFVVINEQVPDGPETGHTGLTVRALHVKLTLPLAPLLRGAEIIVAEAHSDATFR